MRLEPILILLISISSYAQEIPLPPEIECFNCPQVEEVYQFPDSAAKFPGGMDAILKYISENMKYPDILCSLLGTVYIGFIIEKDGSVSNIEVLRGIHPELDKEAVRVIKSMPSWQPAYEQGKIVRSREVLPVRFEMK